MSNNVENGGPKRERHLNVLPLPGPSKHRGTLSNSISSNNDVKQPIVTQVAKPAIPNLALATVNSAQQPNLPQESVEINPSIQTTPMDMVQQLIQSN